MRIVRPPLPGAGGLLALAIVVVMAYPVAHSASRTDLQSARVSLSAARDALSAAAAEFRSLQAGGGLSRSDTKDYVEYLSRLRGSVSSNCRTVLELKFELGEVGPEPGCDPEQLEPAGPVSFPGERTEQERVATLDGELGRSMSEFDELLLREMDELQRKRSGSPDASGRSGGGAGGAAGSEGEGEGEATTQDGGRADGGGEPEQGREQEGEDQPQGDEEAAQSEGGDQQGSAQEGGRPGGQDPSRTASRDAPPADDDDDIVARQLREAAEKETDPVLREKLWEEYRRYKEKQTAQSKNLN